MPARIKVFLDPNCTQEVQRDPTTGYLLFTYFKTNVDETVTPYITGVEGEVGQLLLYLKNVGTRAALNTRLIFQSTNNQYFLDSYTYEVGDIAVNTVKPALIKFSVKAWTAAQISENYFTIDYYSLPDITTDVNPYNEGNYIAEETNSGVVIEAT